MTPEQLQVIPARGAETDHMHWPQQVQQLGCALMTNRPEALTPAVMKGHGCELRFDGNQLK